MPFDSFVVPPQNEATYNILLAKESLGVTYWYNTKGYSTTNVFDIHVFP